MDILIAETGGPPQDLRGEFGGYADMMQQMIAPQHQFEVIDIVGGARVPEPKANSALLVTGSPAGVYEGHEWIAPLEARIREFLAAGKKVLGICFGHQLMAQALGGKVEKSLKGWGVGVHGYDCLQGTGAIPKDLQRFACVVSHQDQVIDLPTGAQRLAGSPFCQNGIVSYADGLGLSFQMHPEFSAAYGQALLRSRRHQMPAEVYELGIASYDGGNDRAVLAQWVNQFLEGEK